MVNYFFSGDDVPVDSEILLVTDFVNLKIKSVILSKMLIELECACVFIGVSVHTYISICSISQN
jgi:hypothetical protein